MKTKIKSLTLKVLSAFAVMLIAFALGCNNPATLIAFGAIGIVASHIVSKRSQLTGLAALSVITPGDVTFSGKEIMSLNEAVYEKVFMKPGLDAIHSIATGIKAKQQIVFLGRLGLVGKKRASCDPTPNAGGVSMSEKFWDPEYIGDRFEQCWKDLLPSFFVWGMKNGLQKEDLTDTDFANFMEDRLSDAIAESILRHAHFGDKAAEVVGSGGNLTAGTDKTYFNVIDGLWAQWIDIATADTDRRVTIDKNAETTFADQKFDATDTTAKVAESIFEALKYNADYRLRDSSDLMILCTQSLADQYAKELRSRNIDASYQRIEGGYRALMFEGIPIVPINFWDRTISAYFSTGTKYYLPHRAVLISKSEVWIGTEDESNLSEMDSFYDRKSKKYIVDFGYSLDAKQKSDYMVQVAY